MTIDKCTHARLPYGRSQDETVFVPDIVGKVSVQWRIGEGGRGGHWAMTSFGLIRLILFQYFSFAPLHFKLMDA